MLHRKQVQLKRFDPTQHRLHMFNTFRCRTASSRLHRAIQPLNTAARLPELCSWNVQKLHNNTVNSPL